MVNEFQLRSNQVLCVRILTETIFGEALHTSRPNPGLPRSSGSENQRTNTKKNPCVLLCKTESTGFSCTGGYILKGRVFFLYFVFKSSIYGNAA